MLLQEELLHATKVTAQASGGFLGIGSISSSEQDMLDLIDYCAQDVRAMRAISQALRPLSDEELADYHTNERINDRGVLVDVPLAHAAQRYAAVELEEI